LPPYLRDSPEETFTKKRDWLEFASGLFVH